MSFRDRAANDISRTFMRTDQFGEEHYWNGQRIICVPDDEEGLKGKNNNVVDLSWDNNAREILIHTPLNGFPGGREPEPNTHVIFDDRSMKVLSVAHNLGVLGIKLVAVDPREIL